MKFKPQKTDLASRIYNVSQTPELTPKSTAGRGLDLTVLVCESM